MANLYKPDVVKIDPQTKKKIKTKTKKWYGRYRDENGVERRIPLSENKTIAQQHLAELLKQVDRIKNGLVSVAEFEMKKNIDKHLDDYETHLKSRNNSSKHVKEIIAKIKRAIENCNWKNPSQINASDVEHFLVELRDDFGCSIETSNHYLQALKSFCNWMYIHKRHIEHPLTSLSKMNSRVDRRHDRRALNSEEFQLLMNAAETGPPIEGISGIDRSIMYLLASYTGFRKGEIGSLTMENICFDNESQTTIIVDACYSKRRRYDVLPLHVSVVNKIKEWIAMKNPKPDEILFPVSERAGGVERKTSKMIQFDLTSARTFWIAESKTP
ncbi:MAG: tyrosine-type recombinase/integrase, partial [Planctomycetaceae bacterium]|nr:tyrosine-type recombinase/integrase [Planctomycetaceae bacterium]